GVNKTIVDKNSITKNTFVDWASGSFLLFTSQLYERLEGFDTKYYMYCEDIDICLRANLIIGAKLTYIPSVRAIHLAAHANRKLFSKNFIWHFSSAMRYLNRRRSLLYR
ncbi:glycosyltransferase family 2 protein, partial [Cronobacter sakazakii]